MNDTSTITSLSELRERKEQLSAELDYSKEALIQSIKPASSSAGNFLLKDVALPAIGLGIAFFAVTKIMSRSKKRNFQRKEALEERAFQRPVETTSTNPSVQQRSHSVASGNSIIAASPAQRNRIAPLMKLAGIVIPATQAVLAAVKEGK